MRSVRSRASARRSVADRRVASAIEIGEPQVPPASSSTVWTFSSAAASRSRAARKPRDTLLEEGERGIQLHVVGLEPPDDLLQPVQIVGDAHRGLHPGADVAVGHAQTEGAPGRKSAAALEDVAVGDPRGTA